MRDAIERGDWIHSNDARALDMAIEALQYDTVEPLTDAEQRLFLTAMWREEKICSRVDDECRNYKEPYKDSLVRSCHEIIRKVKGALWTI